MNTKDLTLKCRREREKEKESLKNETEMMSTERRDGGKRAACQRRPRARTDKSCQEHPVSATHCDLSCEIHIWSPPQFLGQNT